MATGWSRRVRREAQRGITNNTPTFDTTFAAGLSTANPGDDGASNAEPTSTGGYARQAFTFSDPALPSNDASCNAVNSADISWTSTAAFSTGATNLTHVSLWNSTTLANVAESYYIGRAAISVPQAVNAAGITLTISAGNLVMGMVSA